MNKFSIINESETTKVVETGIKKFSNLSEEVEKSDTSIELVYDGYLKIKKDKNGYEYVSESDCVVGMIHFVESDEILMRREPVPPFQERDSKPDMKYLTVLSGTIDKDETPIETLTREMVEEAGIVLNTSFDMLEYLGNFYFNKGNSAKYHLYYVPLYINDYRTIKIKGDGSELEKMSENIVIETQYLDEVIPSDLISALCIEKLKMKLFRK